MKPDDLVGLILDTVREYATVVDGHEPADLGPDTRLFGRAGPLDSVGLVSVLVDIEQRLNDEHGMGVSLMDERAMSQTRSPFRSAQALADYILENVPDG